MMDVVCKFYGAIQDIWVTLFAKIMDNKPEEMWLQVG